MGLYDQYRARETKPVRLAGGWQTGDPLAIARRYSTTPGQLQTNRDQIGALTPPPMVPRGAAGDTGSATPPAPMTDIPQPPGPAQMPPPGSTPPQGVQQPSGNARQRWMDAGGSQHTYNKANVARGVRPQVDARATPSPQNSTASADIRAGWGWNRAGSMDLPY